MSNTTEVIKGYKAFDADFRCRGYQFRVGETFEMPESPAMCVRGFHFCLSPVDVNYYYNWTYEYHPKGLIPPMRFAEVEAMGTTVTEANKSVTNKLRIIREIPREEFEKLCTGTFVSNGLKRVYHNGLLHNESGPAVETEGGKREWRLFGELHRSETEGPAIIDADGTTQWYKKGKLHRDDGPAIEHHSGLKEWWKCGLFIESKLCNF